MSTIAWPTPWPSYGAWRHDTESITAQTDTENVRQNVTVSGLADAIR